MENFIKNFNIDKKHFVIFFVGMSIIFYFLIYIIFGSRGMIDYQSLKTLNLQKNLEKDKIFIQIQNKSNLVNNIKNKSLDLDLLDEQVRKNLGYVKSNEIIINKD